MTDEKQPFFSHLKELRDRLVVSIIAVAVAFIITYYFKERLFDFLMQPFIRVMPAQSSFIFTGITEAFLTYFKISVVAALFLAAPVILYEFWMFVAPGLYENEKKYVYPFIFSGSLCFICGALFCYFVVMPNIYRFFVSYAQDFVIPMPDLKNYMGLTLKLLIIFGLIFELPLVAFYLSRAGIINARILAKKRRYAILAVFIISAIITPPDVVSMILIALPLWGLYELGILIAKVFGKKEISDEAA
jgi:sec-independent protein translocase protein TatC